MILPRSHTWMHLLPSDSRYRCLGTPDWFADPLPQSGEDVLVAWQHAAVSIDQLLQAKAVVSINAPRGLRAIAHRAGLTHQRSYAAIPNLQEPRWLIPLDSPAVSIAGFCLFTPFRLSAHLKLSLAKVAIRAHLPIWRNDVITVAQRDRGPLESRLQALFPAERVSLAFSSGAEGPDARRKPAVAVLSADGRKLAFTKIAGSPVAVEMLKREAAILPAVQSHPHCASLAPRLLFAGDIDGTYAIAQSPLVGRRPSSHLTAAHERFLSALQGQARRPASQSEMVQHLREQVAADDALRDYLDQAMPILESTIVPTTITHTDFAPWNLRQTSAGLAAFDWDTAELDGLPLYDRWHHELIAGYCLSNWDSRRAVGYLLGEASRRPLGLDWEQVSSLQVVCLVHEIARMLQQGHALEHEMVQYYRDCLRAVSRGATTKPLPAGCNA